MPTRPLDPLTGLADRGAFEADFPPAIALAQKAGQPLALLMVDVDYLKEVNDNYSLAKGDEVVRALAARLQAAVEGKGAAYRWGGEEIAVSLPNHSLREALAVAERIRRSIAASPVVHVAVTVSVGVAVLPDHAADAKGLFDAAERAVHNAKQQGRNRVCYLRLEALG